MCRVFAGLAVVLLVACGGASAPTATPPLPKLGAINGDQWLAMPVDQRVALMDQALRESLRCPRSVTSNDLATGVTQVASTKSTTADVGTILTALATAKGCAPVNQTDAPLSNPTAVSLTPFVQVPSATPSR